MASREITVTFRLEWQETEPDGNTCFKCGDAIYLREWEAVARMKNWPLVRTKVFSCDACKWGLGDP